MALDRLVHIADIDGSCVYTLHNHGLMIECETRLENMEF